MTKAYGLMTAASGDQGCSPTCAAFSGDGGNRSAVDHGRRRSPGLEKGKEISFLSQVDQTVQKRSSEHRKGSYSDYTLLKAFKKVPAIETTLSTGLGRSRSPVWLRRVSEAGRGSCTWPA